MQCYLIGLKFDMLFFILLINSCLYWLYAGQYMKKKWISTLIWFVLHDLQILSFSGIFLYRPLSIARKWSLILNLQIVDLYELYLQAPTQEGLWFNFKILLKVEVFCFPFNCCIDALNFSTLINDSLFLWRLYYI